MRVAPAATSSGPLEVHLEYDYDYARPGADSSVRQFVTDRRLDDKTAYSYDVLGRLTRARTTDDSSGDVVDDYRYEYDRNSNRLLSQTHNDEQIDYDYNTGGELTSRDRLGDPGQVTYDYDNNGNLTGSSDGLHITYNAANQTTRIAGRTDQPLQLAYAGSGQAERTAKGPISYTDGALGLAGERKGDSATHYTRDANARLVSLRRDNQSNYYLTDAIGTVLAVTKPDGTIGARYSYEPFGQTKGTSGELTQPYRFAGEYYDNDTRLYKIGLRYYDPQTARWTQKDPITGFADPRRTNRYIYAGQDPINHTDPTGASFIKDLVKGASFVKSVGTTFALGIGTAATTAACASATAGSPACGFVAVTGASYTAGSLYVTYREGAELLGGE